MKNSYIMKTSVRVNTLLFLHRLNSSSIIKCPKYLQFQSLYVIIFNIHLQLLKDFFIYLFIHLLIRFYPFVKSPRDVACLPWYFYQNGNQLRHYVYVINYLETNNFSRPLSCGSIIFASHFHLAIKLIHLLTN